MGGRIRIREAALGRRLGLHTTTTTRERLVLRFESPSAGAGFLIRTAGHIMHERTALMNDGRWTRLRRDLTTFVTERAEPVDDAVELPLDYLLTTANTYPARDIS